MLSPKIGLTNGSTLTAAGDAAVGMACARALPVGATRRKDAAAAASKDLEIIRSTLFPRAGSADQRPCGPRLLFCIGATSVAFHRLPCWPTPGKAADPSPVDVRHLLPAWACCGDSWPTRFW